jgi:hypothetical protein
LKGRTEEREIKQRGSFKKVRDKMGDTAIYMESRKEENKERGLLKENIWLKKEIGENDNKKCHLICFLN